MLEAIGLPAISESARLFSEELSDRIKSAIASAGGCIRFDEFMRIALYEPGLGYYLGGAIKFGRAGDFVTAPEISSLFGRCLAREGAGVLAQTGGDILEFGGGSGALAAGILTELGDRGALPPHYFIVELSPELRERQHATIAAQAGAHLERVEWLDRIPSQAMNGFVIANEIIDAFPVRCFKTRAGRIHERCVGVRDGAFTWVDVAASSSFEAAVRERVEAPIIDADFDYASEINTGIEPWLADLGRLMNDAVALVIDYGYPRREYYHASRNCGTLLCHYRHRAHDDPFLFPGLQDITASVDFTEVALQAHRNALRVLGFCEQSSYLLGCGLLDDVAARSAGASDVAAARLAFETKVLTLPTEMGSRFKVLALGKAGDVELRGFHRRDDRHRL